MKIIYLVMVSQPEPPRPIINRYEAEKLPVEQRITSFVEVEQPFDEQTAAF